MSRQIPNTPRSKRYDAAVVLAAATALAPKVQQWATEGEESAATENIIQDLAKAMDHADDGYEIAKNLESRHCYYPDAELVNILEGAFWARRDALQEAERAWLAASGLKEIPLETRVRNVNHRANGIGIVASNYPEGKSTVCYEHLGHARSGQGTYGNIVDWEDLEVIENEVQPT